MNFLLSNIENNDDVYTSDNLDLLNEKKFVFYLNVIDRDYDFQS